MDTIINNNIPVADINEQYDKILEKDLTQEEFLREYAKLCDTFGIFNELECYNLFDNPE